MKLAFKILIMRYRRILIFAVHFVLIVASYFTAFLLRFDCNLSAEYFGVFLRTLPLLLCIKLLVFSYFGLFHGLWRYVSIYDLGQIIKANALASTAFIITNVFLPSTPSVPRFILVNDFIICMVLVSGIRFFSRIVRERYRGPSLKIGKNNVLIIGAGEAGILLLKEYRNNPSLGDVVGFIDDDKVKYNVTIRGVRVLGDRHRIPSAVQSLGVTEIVLAIPSAKGEVVRDIIACCQVSGVRLKIIPGFTKILKGELEIRTREVRPEDLLGRETVDINEGEIRKYLTGKRVLVSGAAGSIGSELCRQTANFSPSKLILVDHNENNIYFLSIELKSRFKGLDILSVVGDINDISLLKKVFSEERPEVVFHAAAYKHVPLMEENPVSAVKNNALGSRNMIYAAHHYGVERFVLISTDKAVNPINAMGLSKRLAEIFLQAKARRSKTKFMAVRFGNVLGSDGSVVPLFKKQIESGGPITLTHAETTRYFMSIKEAVLLVMQAGAIGEGGEIFILDMGEQIRIADLARNLVTLSGLEMGRDIQVEYIGLRPGEKIREELLLDKDKDRITKHDKIYIHQADDFDLVSLRKQLKDLQNFIRSFNGEKVVEKMRQIILSAKHADRGPALEKRAAPVVKEGPKNRLLEVKENS